MVHCLQPGRQPRQVLDSTCIDTIFTIFTISFQKLYIILPVLDHGLLVQPRKHGEAFLKIYKDDDKDDDDDEDDNDKDDDADGNNDVNIDYYDDDDDDSDFDDDGKDDNGDDDNDDEKKNTRYWGG